MAQFLLFGARRKIVQWFMDEYTETLALVPEADGNTHFIGHSNGTYLLARGLTDYATLRVNRVALAGSVIPRAFPWDRFHREGRIQALRNDRAASDLVVGVFPGFYQLIAYWLPRWRYFADIGNGGLRGFDRSAGLDQCEHYYFPGGHGAAVRAQNHRSLAEFVLRPTAWAAPTRLLGRPTAVTDWLSNLCWVVWLLLLGLLVVLAPLGLWSWSGGGYAALALVVGWFAFLVAVLATA